MYRKAVFCCLAGSAVLFMEQKNEPLIVPQRYNKSLAYYMRTGLTLLLSRDDDSA